MRKTTLMSLILATALTTVNALEPIANPSDIKITTGSKKGSYFKYGKRLATSLNIPVDNVMTSRGSVQNLERLEKGEAQIAIAQKDAYKWYKDKHPETSIDLVADLKPECVFVVAKKDGKVNSDSDLQKDGIKIAVGKKGSGASVTWDYMGTLEKGFKKATPVPMGGSRALLKVESGQLDAMLVVFTPDITNKFFDKVLKNPNLKFITVNDWDLDDKLDGKSIYERTEVTVKPKKGLFSSSETVNTICTTASVFINSQVDDDTVDDLADILLTKKNYILKGAN